VIGQQRITDAGGRKFRFRGDLYSQESTFSLVCSVIAKFHYTGPTGPDRTRTTRISEKLRWSVRVSDKVRAGPVEFGRARVVEFSLKL